MKYVLYILHSRSSGKYYIGHTNDLIRRLREHNDPSQKGWTRSYRPWDLKYTEEFAGRNDAMRKERYLKSLKSKMKIEEYIAGWRRGTSRGS